METTPFLCSSFLSMASAYVAILLYMAIRAGVGALVLVLPLLVRPGRLDQEKSTAYECGFFNEDQPRSPFSVSFYLTAIQFLIFDIEVRFQLPWRVGGVCAGFSGFCRLRAFLFILTRGFFYEWQKGAQDWQSFFLFQKARMMRTLYFVASAAEAWQSVPMVSFQVPMMGTVTAFSVWSLSVAAAALIFVGLHSQNHRAAPVRNSGISGFKKAISAFWNTQTLERVHFKWRAFDGRFSGAENTQEIMMNTNRQPRAWSSLADVRGKTTPVWLRVQFFQQLICNCFGLVPLFTAITGQAGFTQGQSFRQLRAITQVGIARRGARFVLQFLPSGPRWTMAPLFILLESISYAFRAISLGTRQYCNMFRGHQLLHLFTSQTQVPLQCTPFVQGAPLTALAACIQMALSALETTVAILQSGVFCQLGGFYQTEVLQQKDELRNPVKSPFFFNTLAEMAKFGKRGSF